MNFIIEQLVPSPGWFALYDQGPMRAVAAFALVREKQEGKNHLYELDSQIHGLVFPDGEPVPELASNMPGFLGFIMIPSWAGGKGDTEE